MPLHDRYVKPELALLEHMRDEAPPGSQTRAFLEGAVMAFHYLCYSGTRPSDVARAMAVTERGVSYQAEVGQRPQIETVARTEEAVK